MMGNFLFLATAATAAAETGGISLNSDLIEANLFNLVLVLIFVFVFGRKLLTEILTERRLAIETAIQDTEARQKQAISALEVAKKNLAQAQTEAENIRKTAVTSAENARAEIAAKAVADIEFRQGIIEPTHFAHRGHSPRSPHARRAIYAVSQSFNHDLGGFAVPTSREPVPPLLD